MENLIPYCKPLSYALVMVVSFICFVLYFLKCLSFTIGHIGFGLLFTMGLFGVCKYGIKQTNIILNSFFASTRCASRLYTLPALVTELYLKNNIFPDFCVAHLIVPAFVYYPLISSKNFQERHDRAVFLCTLSLSVLSIYIDNFFGLHAALVYAILQFNITNRGYIFGLSSTYFYNFGLATFSILSYHALVKSAIAF